MSRPGLQKQKTERFKVDEGGTAQSPREVLPSQQQTAPKTRGSRKFIEQQLLRARAERKGREPLRRLDKEVKAGAPDEKDLEDRERCFRAQLEEYSAMHAELVEDLRKRTQPSTSEKPGTKVSSREQPGPARHLAAAAEQLLKPPFSPMEVQDSFRRWREAFVGQVTSLDGLLPALQLTAEHLRGEVENAGSQVCGADSFQAFLHQQMLRRRDALRNQRAMFVDRLTDRPRPSAVREARNASSPQGDSPDSATESAALEKALKLLQREIQACEGRVPFLRSCSDPNAGPAIGKWTASIVVVLRQHLYEDMSTRPLRRLQQQLPYAAIGQRSRLWRRALDTQAALDNLQHGEGGSSPSSAVPLGPTARRRLEVCLKELGPTWGCQASLHVDKGKTFAHHVAITFPTVFWKQQARMEFRTYPMGSDPSAAEKAAQALVLPDTVDLAKQAADAIAWWLKPSEWAGKSPWHPKVDRDIKEQSVLLKSSFTAANMPVRMAHQKPSYARELLENVLATAKPQADANAGEGTSWEPDVDSLLRAEQTLIKVGDANTIIRHLGERADRAKQHHSGDDAQAAGAGGAKEGAAHREANPTDEVPRPLLRAYHMLRHLQMRERRWKLLSALNFFRFVHRRLVAGLPDTSGPDGKPLEREPVVKPVERGKYWDLSPRTLGRLCRQCPLPSGRQPNSHMAFERELVEVLDAYDRSQYLIVVDGLGRRVMHEAALDDLESLEREMLSIGSFFIHKFEASLGEDQEHPVVDRGGVLYDLYAAEVWFNQEKVQLVSTYFEIYEHTAELQEKQDLAQRIVDVLAVRPRLDLDEAYFTTAYAASISLLSSRTELLRSLLKHQIHIERNVNADGTRRNTPRQSVISPLQPVQSSEDPRARRRRSSASIRRSSAPRVEATATERETPSEGSAEDSHAKSTNSYLSSLAHSNEGLGIASTLPESAWVNLSCPESVPVALDEFCASACLVWKVELIMEEVHRDLAAHFHPGSPVVNTLLETACFQFAAERWKAEQDEEEQRGGDARPQHEDPEVLLQVVKEIAKLLGSSLSAAVSTHAHEESAPGTLDIRGFLTPGYAEVRRVCQQNVPMMMGLILSGLLEVVHLRRSLSSAAFQVLTLERILKAQAAACGLRYDHLRLPPPPDSVAPTPEEDTRRQTENPAALAATQNTWIDPSGPMLSAGMFRGDVAPCDLGTVRGVGINSSPNRVQELRNLYQSEIAYRDLLVACVQHNALLVTPQVRQRELSEVAIVGAPRDLAASHLSVTAAHTAAERLRETAELSLPLKGAQGPRSQRRRAKTEAFVDLSRAANQIQMPASYIGPIQQAVVTLFKERSDDFLRNYTRQSDIDYQSRILWFHLISCGSLLVVRAACDVSVRVQAAEAVVAFRGMSLLIPSALTPFDRSTGMGRPQLLDRDGQVGSIFSVPQVTDVLQLRGFQGQEDSAKRLREVFDASAKGAFGGSMAMGKRATLSRGATRQSFGVGVARPSVVSVSGEAMSRTPSAAGNLTPRTPAAEAASPEGLVAPRLEISYDGSAFVVLNLVHELTALLVLRYTLATVVGDALTFLRMQRFVRFNFGELDTAQVGDSVGNSLSKTEPTFEALEELVCDLAQLAYRLDAMGEGARDAGKALWVVRSEVRAAHRQVALLFRKAAHASLRMGCEADMRDLRWWICHLEGRREDCEPHPKVIPERAARPLVSQKAFAVDTRRGAEDLVILTGRGRAAAPGGLATGSQTEGPETMTWRQDWDRYIAAHHPMLMKHHPLLDPFLHALLMPIAGCLPRTSMGTAAEDHVQQPYSARYPGSLPPPPLCQLLSAVAMLPEPRRKQLSRISAELTEKRTAFHRLHQLRPKSEELTEADCELFGSMLLMDILKEHVVCGRLACPPPLTKAAQAEFEEHFHIAFPPLPGTHDDSEEESDNEGCHGSFLPSRAVEEVSNEKILQDMELAYHRIRQLVSALDRMLTSVASERLSREFSAVAELLYWRTASSNTKASQKARRSSLPMLGQGLDRYAAKVDSIMHAMNGLKGTGTYVEMEPSGASGERAYVLREKDLNICIEELMENLAWWAQTMITGRERCTREQLDFHRSRSDAFRKILYSASGKMPSERRRASVEVATVGISSGTTIDSTKLQDEEAARRVGSRVAERSCQLTFAVDRLHRVIRDLRVVSHELEYRLSSEVWEKVRSSITALTSMLTNETGKFRQDHAERAHHLARQMRQIREHAAGEFARLAAKNFSTQERAAQPRQQRSQDEVMEETKKDILKEDLMQEADERAPKRDEEPERQEERLLVSDAMHKKVQDVARRDDVRILLVQIEDLKNRQICARIFHHFKCQAMRQKFDEQMKALRMTLESNSELSEQLAQGAHQERAASTDFSASARQMSMAEQRIAELQAQVESNMEQKDKLQTWRKNKSRQLAHIATAIKEHNRTQLHDVASMVKEIQTKSELVKQLVAQRELDEAAAQASKRTSSAQTARVRNDLKMQRQEKDEAHETLQRLRQEVEMGSMADEERLQLWRGRCVAVRQHIENLQEEQRRLQQLQSMDMQYD